MEARTISINGVIQRNTLLRIPYFQRRYVWGEEDWKRFALDLGADEFPSFSGDDREKDVQALRQWIASAVQAFVRGKGLAEIANQWKDDAE